MGVVGEKRCDNCRGIIILLLLLLIYCNSVFSISALFSGVIKDGEIKNGITFDVGKDEIYAVANGTFVAIDKNHCREISDLQVCAKGIDETDSGYTAQIEIYDKKYDFSIKRVLGKNGIYFNEIINVTVNITNIGYLNAPLFLYTDTYPLEVEIIPNNVGNVVENKFRYVGNLSSKASVIINYSIRPIAKIKANLRGELLSNGTNFYSDLSLIESKSPVFITINKTSRYFKVGDFFNYTIYMNNSLNMSTNATAIISLPYGMQFIDGEREKTAVFNFKNDTVLNKTFQIRCLFTGNDPIIIKTNVDNGIKFSLDDYIDYITISFEKPILSDNINKQYTKGEKANFFISYKNFGRNITDVVFLMSSDILPNKKITLSNFYENQTFVLCDEDVLLSLNASPDYYINASYFFNTDFGELLYDSSFYNFSTTEYSNVTVSYVLNKEVDSLNDVHVLVIAKNNMKFTIENIEAYDEFDERFFKSGVNINQISLGPEESKTIYEYTLSTPYVLDVVRYNITTHLKYRFGDDDFFVTSSTYFNINPLKFQKSNYKISVEKTIEYPKNFSVGDEFYINYKFENGESFSMKNILVEFPLSSDYESIGSNYYILQKLDPQEVIYIDHLEKLRPVSNVSFDMPYTKIYFQDDSGIRYSSNSNELKTVPVNSKYDIDGPLIFMNNSFISYVENGAYFEIFVTNKGKNPASLKMSYNNKNSNLILLPKETKKISYTIDFSANGNYTISDAMATYEYLGENHTVLSKGKTLEFLNYVKDENENSVVSSVKSGNDKSGLDIEDDEINNNPEKQKLNYAGNFFTGPWIIITVIAVSVILLIVVFFEVRKHKL